MGRIELIELIKSNVYENETNDITGEKLQDTLVAMVESVFDSEHTHQFSYKGVFENLTKLNTKHPTAEIGDSADVVTIVMVSGSPVEELHKYVWDGTEWVDKGTMGSDTPEVVKQKYESLEDSLLKEDKKRIDELEKLSDNEFLLSVQSSGQKEVLDIFDTSKHHAVIIEFLVTMDGLLQMGTIKMSENHFYILNIIGDDIDIEFLPTLTHTILIKNNDILFDADIQLKSKYFYKK